MSGYLLWFLANLNCAAKWQVLACWHNCART